MARAVWAATVKHKVSPRAYPARSSAMGSGADAELWTATTGRGGGRAAKDCAGGALSSVLTGFAAGAGAGAGAAI